MDEALILERLDNLSKEIQSLKSGVLEELKKDLLPVIKQATPGIMSFLSDVEGQYSNEELALLVKKLLFNIHNLNSLLDMLKAGMELKDDLGPVVKQTLPNVTEFMAELDGQFDTGQLSALLRKTLTNLGNFNNALDMFKAGMELKDDMGPVVKQALPKVTEFMTELEGQFDTDELSALLHKTLTNLGNFNAALDMLKAGMELKDDMGPVVKQALPKVTEFMSELDGQFDTEELVALLRKTLTNLGNFNTALDMLKAGMELKDDMGPVVKQALPKVTQFMAELDGQFDTEQLSALLHKTLANLGNFNTALDMLKAGMELKEDIGPVVKQALPKITGFMADLDGQFDTEQLVALLHKTLTNIGNFNTALDMLKAGMELKDDMGPVVKQALPKVTQFMAELEGQFKIEELVPLLHKTLANLGNFNTALDMLKAGMELKDDMGPVVKQFLPKVTEFMAEVEGQVDAAELVALLRKTLINLGNFNTALDMLKAGMELKDDMAPVVKQFLPKVTEFMAELDGQVNIKVLPHLIQNLLVNLENFDRMLGMVKPGIELVDELGNVMKQCNVITRVVSLLDDLEKRGVFKILKRMTGAFEGFRCSEGQLQTMCQAISEVDLATPKYVGALEVMNEIRDPNVQETMGAAFKVMRAVGCCLRANRMRHIEEQFPAEYPGTAAQDSESCV